MGNLKDINYGIGKYLTADDATSIPDIESNRVNLDTLNFKLASNTSYALYNMKDGFIEAFEGRDDAPNWRLHEDCTVFELLVACLEGVETVHR